MDVANLRTENSCWLSASDAQTMLPRRYIGSSVVNYICFALNKSGSPRFNDVYCMTPTILPAFFCGGNDEKIIKGKPYEPLPEDYSALFFHPTDFRGKKLIFLPCCWREHWLLYALDVQNYVFCMLDPLHTSCPSDGRLRIDIFSMKFLLDLMRLSSSLPQRLPADPPIQYIRLPGQPNSFDCGLFVIKWMELWSPSVQFSPWDDETCSRMRKEIILSLLLNDQNSTKSLIVREANVLLANAAKLWDDVSLSDAAKMASAAKVADSTKVADTAKPTTTYKRKRERKPGRQQKSPYTDVSTAELEPAGRKTKQRARKH